MYIQYLCCLLVFLVFAGIVNGQDTTGLKNEEVVYDTLIIEKAPLIINKTVYLPGKRGNSGQFFVQANYGLQIYKPSSVLEVKNLDSLKVISGRSQVMGIDFGYYSNFIKIQLGVKSSVFDQQYQLFQNKWEYDTTHFIMADTIDSYTIDNKGVKEWHYVIEYHPGNRIDSTIHSDNFSNHVKIKAIQISVTIGIPVYVSNWVFTPHASIVMELFGRSKPGLPGFYPESYSNNSLFINSSYGLNIGYMLKKFLMLAGEANVSYRHGKKPLIAQYKRTINASACIQYLF